MQTSVFLNFVFLQIYKHKSRHLAIFILSIFIVFLCCSTLFIKDSLQNSLFKTLENHSDFIIQNKFNKNKLVTN